VIIASAPTGGSLQIDPESGTTFSTNFYFEATNWTDNQQPLLFRFV
jgi:hypothetical protein